VQPGNFPLNQIVKPRFGCKDHPTTAHREPEAGDRHLEFGRHRLSERALPSRAVHRNRSILGNDGVKLLLDLGEVASQLGQDSASQEQQHQPLGPRGAKGLQHSRDRSVIPGQGPVVIDRDRAKQVAHRDSSLRTR
jgi:hypothetical protein